MNGKITFAMSDHEIRESYRWAKNQKLQIGILADLCVVSRPAMREKLAELGFPVKVGKPAHNAKFDRETALSLYEKGFNDLQIALELGVCKQTVYVWRRRNRLPYIAKSQLHSVESQENEKEEAEEKEKCFFRKMNREGVKSQAE